MGARDGRWIIPLDPLTRAGQAREASAARLHLVCFPYAGGGTSVFRPWATSLPPSVSLFGVSLPGRESRFGEPFVVRVPELADAAAAAVRELGDRPLVFFGHSMGAILAFETARALRRARATRPALLVVGACRAPDMPRRYAPIHRHTDAAILDEIRRLGGTPADVLADREMMKLVLPIVRADFEAFETYEYAPGDPLECPLVVLGGVDDPSVDPQELEGWRRHTSQRASVHTLPGDHWFIHTHSVELLRILREEIAAIRS